jgi:hypothetical protein
MSLQTSPWNSRTITFVILAVLLLIMTTAVSAETIKSNTTEDWSADRSDPCNGDWVHFEGKVHAMSNQTDQNNGSIHLVMSTQETGNGVGTLLFGAPPQYLKYTYQSKINTNAKFPASPDGMPIAIFRTREKVVSQGANPAPDNYFLSSRVQLFRNGTTKTDFESDCRGQGKDPYP